VADIGSGNTDRAAGIGPEAGEKRVESGGLASGTRIIALSGSPRPFAGAAFTVRNKSTVDARFDIKQGHPFTTAAQWRLTAGNIMSITAYITHPACLRHEMGADHPECPARLSVIQDYLLARGYLDLMPPYTAPAATDQQILRAHTALHLANIRSEAPMDGYVRIDPDTSMNPYTLDAAMHAAGAAVLATDIVMKGEAGRAFCAVRPPGHHAERDAAMGFCFFNNAAIAIRHAQEVHGVKRVALIDFDVHHGNGSENILANDPGVLMVSTFQSQLYPWQGEVPLGDNMVNVPLPPRTTGDKMREAVTARWRPALEAFKPELIVISAGFDAHREDELANLGWVEADYAWLTARIVEVADRHAQGRIVSTLEGGYALGALARSVGAHVGVLIGAQDA
jgi:acetoin utilization deacetylase AcuC-like enzyme